MYLKSIDIQNFRSCFDTKVQFQPSLTLLVGENNCGKSNVITALRLATTPLTGRQTRYFEESDTSYGCTGPIQLAIELDGLTDIQQGRCSTALDWDTKCAWYAKRFTPGTANPRRVSPELLSGRPLAPDQEPAMRGQIKHVYLEPLRDAQRELDSSAGNRLSFIIQSLFGEEDRRGFLNIAREQLRLLEAHELIDGTRSQLQVHINDLTNALRGQTIGIGYQDVALHRLTRGLRIKMAEYGIDLADIADSGLGYANLLFMATVILELRHAQDAELTLFLVEEPEAHLHPQLQAVLLDYLQDQANKSTRDDRREPAGRIQVIATTHSPNFASAVGTERIVVLRTIDRRLQVGDDAPGRVRETVALPLCAVDLTAAERRKINQYLDVTRCELLFTRRAILVEGIAEAVVLPVLASKCVFSDGTDDDRLKLRQFRGTSIIAVGSVDFAPYIRLLLQRVNGVRLADRLIVITDGDPLLPQAVETAEGENDVDSDDPEDAKPFNRRENLEQLAQDLDAVEVFTVAESRFTFEADLLDPFNVNREVMREAFLSQKSRSQRFWATVEASDNPSETFYRKMRTTKKFLGKGEFAHDVSRLINSGRQFTCPGYLRVAIEGVLDGVQRADHH
jgi:putative ATP-dependent endonuclease of OLD family